MTLDARETSVHDGAPVELYRFSRGTQHWLYTTDADAFTGPDGSYVPMAIKRSAPSLSKEARHSGLQLDVARDFPIAMLFQAGAPGSSIWLTLFRAHRGDAEIVALWQGKVRGVSWTGSRAQVQCDPRGASLTRSTLRAGYGPACGRRLYSATCGAREDLNSYPATLSALSSNGLALTSSVFGTAPAGAWVRGEIYHPALDARRQIIAHVGSTVTLAVAIPGMKAGDVVTLIRGCDHLWKRSDGSWGDCVAVFGNADNYGGHPFVPTKNPFETGLDG